MEAFTTVMVLAAGAAVAARVFNVATTWKKKPVETAPIDPPPNPPAEPPAPAEPQRSFRVVEKTVPRGAPAELPEAAEKLVTPEVAPVAPATPDNDKKTKKKLNDGVELALTAVRASKNQAMLSVAIGKLADNPQFRMSKYVRGCESAVAEALKATALWLLREGLADDPMTAVKQASRIYAGE